MSPELADARSLAGGLAERERGGLPPIRLTPSPTGHARRGVVVTRALRAAASRLSDVEAALAFADAPPAATANALCEAILEWRDGESHVSGALPAGRGAQHLLAELRTAFLEEIEIVSTRVRAGEVIHVMRAFEAVAGMLAQAGEGARELVESRGTGVVVEVAHDMRSPLSSILFLVETLRRGQSGAVNSIQERQLGLVYSAALGLSSLTSDLIELGRSGDRLLEGGPTPFSVREIFDGVRDIVLPIAEEKGLELRVDPPESDWRMGCPIALHRVLLNLTTNALKFTSQGFVEVSARQLNGGYVEFSVTDSGRGIPADLLPSLCDGLRARNAGGSYSFSSVGLGLSICRKLVRKMGGDLRAESTEHVGSRLQFTLELPAAPRI